MSGCPEQQNKKVQPHTEFENLFDNFALLCVRAVSFSPLAPCRGAPNSKARKPTTKCVREPVRQLGPTLHPCCFVFTIGAMSGGPEQQSQKVQRQTQFENLCDHFAPFCFRSVSFSPLAPCPGAPNTKTRKSSDRLNSRTCSTTLASFASALFRFHHWRHVRVPRTAKQENPATN